MRGLTSFGAAILLMAIAGWTASRSGVNAASMAFAAASCVLLFRGVQGQGLKTSAGDASGTLDFVRNPGEAIVESAIDTIGEFLKDDVKRPEAEGKSAFDADAAIARYMASRPEQAPVPGAAAPVRAQFGRKGLTSGS